jgi:hypothetical protein
MVEKTVTMGCGATVLICAEELPVLPTIAFGYLSTQQNNKCYLFSPNNILVLL